MTKIIGLRNLEKVSQETLQNAMKEMNLLSKMEQDTRANGKTAWDTDKVSKFGLMELSTKDSGKITKLMVKVFSGMFMVTSTKAIGREIKPTDMVNTLTAMA